MLFSSLPSWLALSLVLTPLPTLVSADPQASLSGPANIIAAGTYPRAAHLSDGSLISAYTVTASSITTLALSRSTNNGSTWGPLGSATSGSSTTHDIDNPFPLQLPSGRVLLAFRNHDRAGPDDYSYFRITVVASDDGGASWKYLSTPAENAGPKGHGLWEPFMRVAADDGGGGGGGALQIYYSKENSLADQDNLVRTSADGGATWSAPALVSGGGLADARDGMVGVASDGPGGDLIAVFETSLNGQFTINSVTSGDDGKTWGNRRPVYRPAGTGNNAGAPQVANVGGTLVASFMTDEDSPDHGTWVSDPAAKLVVSADGGASWRNKLTWSPANSFWPGLLTLDEKSVLGLVDHNGAKAQKIVLS